jgi:hypothetical protein
MVGVIVILATCVARRKDAADANRKNRSATGPVATDAVDVDATSA